VPFFGTASVGYLPRGRVIGLSKIPRVIEMFARRLQVQERMTQQIADFLQHRLNPYGVGVVIEAEHLCLAMRGVQKGGATMVTSSVLGTFRTTKETRHEFMSHLPCAVTCRRCPLHPASVRGVPSPHTRVGQPLRTIKT